MFGAVSLPSEWEVHASHHPKHPLPKLQWCPMAPHSHSSGGSDVTCQACSKPSVWQLCCYFCMDRHISVFEPLWSAAHPAQACSREKPLHTLDSVPRQGWAAERGHGTKQAFAVQNWTQKGLSSPSLWQPAGDPAGQRRSSITCFSAGKGPNWVIRRENPLYCG